MKGKVIDKSLENYGQVVDVVLNKYMGKYTDGVKTYPKDSISFDNVDEVDSNEPVNKELNELAFRILLAKESATAEKCDKDKIVEQIDYAFGVAKLFQLHSIIVQTSDKKIKEEGCPCTGECQCDNAPVIEAETDVTEPVTKKCKRKQAEAEKQPVEEEKGLNDYLAELGE